MNQASGLHQRDNDKLLATLKKLRDLGNTVLVVEHDEDTMYAADQIIDIGPGAGVNGGNVIAQRNSRRNKKCSKFNYRSILKWKKKNFCTKKEEKSKTRINSNKRCKGK